MKVFCYILLSLLLFFSMGCDKEEIVKNIVIIPHRVITFVNTPIYFEFYYRDGNNMRKVEISKIEVKTPGCEWKNNALWISQETSQALEVVLYSPKYEITQTVFVYALSPLQDPIVRITQMETIAIEEASIDAKLAIAKELQAIFKKIDPNTVTTSQETLRGVKIGTPVWNSDKTCVTVEGKIESQFIEFLVKKKLGDESVKNFPNIIPDQIVVTGKAYLVK